MTYQVLARKWRPKQFKDLIGQQTITQAMSYALTTQRLHHAYLFTGSSGVGKTTIARILAKCLNCEQGISPTPCGQCQTCQAIELGRFIDLLEIDAASKTKVEDTRELLENVMYTPTQGRYKIYLIDEVHMLSGHSFNALLKTLEEPPEYVIFFLATTDPQKLPITVLSRCLQFQLKTITSDLLSKHLAYILKQEAIDFEVSALDLLANAAKGSARDALSLLDQAIATAGGTITQAVVRNMLGVQGQQLIAPLAQQILSKNSFEALVISQQLTEISADFGYILEQLTQLFHDLSIKQLACDFPLNNPIISDSQLAQLSSLCDAQDLQLLYQIALLAKRDLTLAPSTASGFNMALLRMIAFRIDSHNLQPTTKNSDNAIKSKKPSLATAQTIINHQPATTVFKQENQTWQELLPLLGLSAFSKALAEHLHFERKESDHFYFHLEEIHAPMLQEKHRARINQALSDYFARPIKLSIEISRGAKSEASVLEQRVEQKNQQQQQAMQSFQQDKNLQKIVSQFDGTLIIESLEVN